MAIRVLIITAFLNQGIRELLREGFGGLSGVLFSRGFFSYYINQL